MVKRNRLVIDDEAECDDNNDSEEEYDAENDTEGSLKEFIDNDDEAEDEIEDTASEDEELKTPTTRSANLLLKGSKANATESQTVKKTKQQKKPAKSKQPAKKKARKSPAEPEKLPGDLSYPLSNWSLTITKTGGDIAAELLEILNSFLHEHCTKGKFV